MGVMKVRRSKQRDRYIVSKNSTKRELVTPPWRLRHVDVRIKNCCKSLRVQPVYTRVFIDIRKVNLHQFFWKKSGVYLRQPKVLLEHIRAGVHVIENVPPGEASDHLTTALATDSPLVLAEKRIAKVTVQDKLRDKKKINKKHTSLKTKPNQKKIISCPHCSVCQNRKGKENCKNIPNCLTPPREKRPLRQLHDTTSNKRTSVSCRVDVRNINKVFIRKSGRMNGTDPDAESTVHVVEEADNLKENSSVDSASQRSPVLNAPDLDQPPCDLREDQLPTDAIEKTTVKDDSNSEDIEVHIREVDDTMSKSADLNADDEISDEPLSTELDLDTDEEPSSTEIESNGLVEEIDDDKSVDENEKSAKIDEECTAVADCDSDMGTTCSNSVASIAAILEKVEVDEPENNDCDPSLNPEICDHAESEVEEENTGDNRDNQTTLSDTDSNAGQSCDNEPMTSKEETTSAAADNISDSDISDKTENTTSQNENITTEEIKLINEKKDTELEVSLQSMSDKPSAPTEDSELKATNDKVEYGAISEGTNSTEAEMDVDVAESKDADVLKSEETEDTEANEAVRIVTASVKAVIDAVPAICDRLSGERIAENDKEVASKLDESLGTPKRKRGRPRKTDKDASNSPLPLDTEAAPATCDRLSGEKSQDNVAESKLDETLDTPKRKRGRPRKTDSDASNSNKKVRTDSESVKKIRVLKVKEKDKEKSGKLFGTPSNTKSKSTPSKAKLNLKGKEKESKKLKNGKDKRQREKTEQNCDKVKVTKSKEDNDNKSANMSKKRKKESDDEEKATKSKDQNGVGKGQTPVNKKQAKSKVVSDKVKGNTKPPVETTSDEESEEEVILSKEDKQELKKMEEFLVKTKLNLVPYPYTKGDGNCWFRAMADQVVLLDIQDKPRNHREMRQAVADFLKDLPQDVKKNTIEVVFLGKPRGLADLAHRQRKLGQWVDDKGVMVLATALYLGRNINIYAYPADNSREFNVTSIEGGPGADKLPAMNVFFDRNHYQSLKKTTTTA